MSKLSTPAISITDSVITISNIDSNATGIGLKNKEKINSFIDLGIEQFKQREVK